VTLPSLSDLIETFAALPDWEARYGYLIDLGRALPAMDPSLKVDAVLVPGCTSRVWLVSEQRGDCLHFHIDSDAAIVKGLAAVLMVMVEGQPAAVIRDLDVGAVFTRLHLADHLSPNRRNGFFAMVERVKKMAG
jgi:cysteine desulfuration protein SufE